MNEDAGRREIVHGSCVAMNGQAVLLLGRSGAGKSATALDLVSRGGCLVADDQVIITRLGEKLVATCPDGFSGRIEARGIGILTVSATAEAELVLAVDLDQTELQRLPPRRRHTVLGVELDLILGRDNWHLSAGVLAFLAGGRTD